MVLTVFLVFCFFSVANTETYYVEFSTFFPSKSGAYINFDSSLLPLTFNSLYRDSQVRWHFNDTWIRTNVSLSVTGFKGKEWLNYSVSGGKQEIYNGFKPSLVAFDGVNQTEGSTWFYSDSILTIFPSSNVSVFWSEATTSPKYSATQSSNALVYGSNFGLQFYEGDSLGLCGQNPLIFDVQSGFWNGSSGAVTVYKDRGRFSFLAENDTVLEVSSPDAPSGIDLSVSGASYTQPSKFVWLVTVTSGKTVTFTWNWRLPSWLDLYFMFGVGMAGLIMMVFAPSWVALGVRRNAFQVDKIERIGYAVLIFCVGFGLFMCWLWS